MNFIWTKKNQIVQNHLWDCRVYNMALRDIAIDIYCKSAGIKNGGWDDFVDYIKDYNGWK